MGARVGRPAKRGPARLTRGRVARGPQGGGATRKEARELMLPPRMYVGRAALIALPATHGATTAVPWLVCKFGAKNTHQSALASRLLVIYFLSSVKRSETAFDGENRAHDGHGPPFRAQVLAL